MNTKLDCELDWYETLIRYHQVFHDRVGFRASDRIHGVNFMTPEALGTWRVGDTLIEVSTGTWGDSRIFGVSVRPHPEGFEGFCETLDDARVLVDRLIGDACTPT